MRRNRVPLMASLAITLGLGWQAPRTLAPDPRLIANFEKVAKYEISITEPKDRTTVPERPTIEGKVSDPSADVWVVVHPTEVSDYWIQPRLTARRDGTFRVSVYIGRPGNVDVGKHFEIMAIANPKDPLKEGDVLRFWPDAQLKSEPIEVIRK